MEIRIIKGSELSTEELDALVRDFLVIRDKVFTEKMKDGYADGEEYFRQQILDPQNIVVCGFNTEGHVVSYVAAVPHNAIYAELKQYDYLLKDDPLNECYYVENIGSIAEGGLASFRVIKKLIGELIREADRRGRRYITMHARVINGLSYMISVFFPVEVERTIDWWYYTDEATHYLVGDIEKVEWLKMEKQTAA